MPDSLALTERAAVMDAEVRAHIKADETAFARINQDTAEIKLAVRELTTEVKQSFQRVHERIDDEAGKARQSLANAVQVARGEIKGASDLAQEAHDQIFDLSTQTAEKIALRDRWLLSSMVVFLLGVLGEAARFFIGSQK